MNYEGKPLNQAIIRKRQNSGDVYLSILTCIPNISIGITPNGASIIRSTSPGKTVDVITVLQKLYSLFH